MEDNMKLATARSLLRSHSFLVLIVLTIAAYCTRASAQNYCGPTTVVNFNSTNGAYPYAGVSFDSQGTMYGTTSNGGASGFGTVWKYTSGGGLTQLFNFSGSSSPSNNGDRPMSPLLIDSQGNLYGTTFDGGNNFSGEGTGYGTLFKLSSSGQFAELHQFSGPEGANPIGAVLLDSAGNLWGTTYDGGTGWNPPNTSGYGTIFKYSSGTVTNPALFNITDGENIQGGMATDGTSYYGTTYQGGANSFGTLFRYNSATGQLTTLFNFNRNPNGGYPLADVLYDGKGNLYGTTYGGGGHSSASNACCGTVWKYSLSSGTLTTLVSFDGDTVPADGISPQGGVTLDANGNIFGTTQQGGSFSDGIVYKYSSTGQLSTLATFNGTNGQFPEGNLAFDSAGNLWGITHQGGSPGYGTVYKLTPNTGGGCGPTVSSVTFNPTSIPNGHSTTGTVTLSGPAPSGGSVVGLGDDQPGVLNIPSRVTVAAGATTATFQGTAQNLFVLSNTVVTTTATLGNSTAQGTVTVTPGINVTSISLNPSTVTAGNGTTATITIASPAPAGGNEVELSQSQNSHFCVLPLVYPNNNPIVTVPAGSTTGTFTIGTTSISASCTAPVYAQSGTTTVSTNFTVNPGNPGPTVSSVTLNPTSVVGGNNSTGTVTLSSAAPSGGSVVSLSSNNSAASVPSTVTVPHGSTSANFTVTTTSVTSTTTALITATLGSSSQQASLTITPASSGPTVSSMTLNPTSVVGGNNSTGTVTLSSPAPSGGSVVSLSSNSSSASVPSSVTVSSGSTSANFTVTTTSVTSTTTAVITATLGSSSQQASLTINPASGSVTLSSMTLNPTSVSGGNNSTGTVTLTGAAPSGGASVTLSSSNTSVATVPSSVTVSAGQTSASFTVRTQRVSSNTNVTISATYSGTTKNATLTVTSGRH
jgi:uncharacterized repeat protein (TIGR03803 family)